MMKITMNQESLYLLDVDDNADDDVDDGDDVE